MAAALARAVAGAARAVLPAVEQMDAQQVAPIERGVDAHAIAGRPRPRRQRHVLVERLIGGGAALQERGGRDQIFRPGAGIVVLHLVVVPGDQATGGGVQALQIRIAAVLRIAVAIERERGRRLSVAVRADRGRRAVDRFVDVVAEEQDEVRLLLRQMAIGGEIAVLVVGAGAEAEAQCGDGAAWRRRGGCAAGRAGPRAEKEAVPIGPARLQAAHLAMDRMGESRFGAGKATLHDATERGLLRDLIADLAIAAERCLGQRRKARPQHEAIGPRRTGGDTEGEGIVASVELPRRG